MRTQTPARKRAALYARVSTGEGMQADGFSIEAQLAEMRQFAARRDWEVVAEFVDVGISGAHEQRPQLQALLAGATEHAFDVLVVHELSRLSRSVYGTFDILEHLGRYAVGFASVKDRDFDFTSPTDRLFLTFLAALNQYYLDLLKMHVRKSKKQRVRQGLYNASIPPLGYRHTGDAKTPPVPEPEEAKIVKLIFEKYATGKYSYQKVADYLNARNYTSRNDNPFSKDSIADIIRNPFYKGSVRYRDGKRDQQHDLVFEGQHEALVSDELWAACHQVRQQHHHASRPFQPQVRTYLLGQLVHCHVCNRRLRSQHTGTRSYYREMSNARGFADCPNARIGARADTLHEQMHAIVRALHLPADWQAEIRAKFGEDEQAVHLRRQRQRLTAERRRLLRDRQRGIYDEDEDLFYSALERIKSELNMLPSPVELDRLERAATKLEYLREVWDEADLEDQHDLLQLMLRRVTVDVAQRRLVMLYPTAPFIPLFRNIPLVEERSLGAFAPLWTPDLVAALEFAYAQLDPLTAVPESPAHLPFLPTWPWPPPPRSRITSALSDALKSRRQAGHEGGLALDVTRPGVPPLRLDTRWWPEARLEHVSLTAALAERAAEVMFLYTPLQLQAHPERDDLIAAAYRCLAPHGTWHAVEIVPEAMPAHWLFHYFPETWAYVQEHYWSPYRIYNRVQKAGFQVEQEERTLYQPVRLRTALAIAQRRPGVLEQLPEPLYQEGVARLTDAIAQRGPEAELNSELTLVVVRAGKESS
jgi:site-specific DNA recombinase